MTWEAGSGYFKCEKWSMNKQERIIGGNWM